MMLTCETSVKLNSHGYVFVPSSGTDPDVTTTQYRNKGVGDNSILVTVSREVLQQIKEHIY